jgi:endonuclease III
MKNTAKHTDRLKALIKSLLKDRPEGLAPMEPLVALVRAAMSYDVPDSKADEAMKHINREFVDLNELRVATELEVQELLGVRYPQIQQRVPMITAALNAIFEREHTLNLDRLKDLSKRDVRQFLRELPELHPFVEAYVMLFAFDGQAFPLDQLMLELLRDEGVVDEGTSLEDAQKFIEHHLRHEDCKDVFLAMRRAVSDEGGRRRKVKSR